MTDVHVSLQLSGNSDKISIRLSERKSSEIYRDMFALQNHHAKLYRSPCQNFAKPG